MTRSIGSRARGGFTLVEVMLALAILGIGLSVILQTVAHNVRTANDAQMMGVVADLARGKMYDLEEILRKDGFQDTDQNSDGNFTDEGRPDVTWEAKVEVPEIPSLSQLQAMQGKQAKEAGSGSEAPEGFESSGLANMMTMFSGGADLGGGGAADQAGMALIQQYYELVQQVFKVSIRKVTLTVHYQVMGYKRDFELTAYFTDDQAMDQVLP